MGLPGFPLSPGFMALVISNDSQDTSFSQSRQRIMRKVCDVGACANVAARPFAHTGYYALPGGPPGPLVKGLVTLLHNGFYKK